MNEKTNGRLRGKWLGITLDATDDQAREAFRQRFGCEPEKIHRGQVIMYVGPIVDGAPGGALSAETG